MSSHLLPISCILALVVSTPSLRAGECDADQSDGDGYQVQLLQSAISMNMPKINISNERHKRQPDNACECLRWHDVYSSRSCEMGEEFCVGFFMHLSGNICVNQGIG